MNSAFKKFEKSYYEGTPNLSYQYSNFQSNFKINIDDKSIGITALNTAWRCWDSNTDKGKILMCSRQISDSESYINDCDIKIALSHHSYTWMNNFEVLQLEKYITQDYDMYFCGHTHSSNAEYCIKPEGKTFKLVAPGIMTANNLEKILNIKMVFQLLIMIWIMHLLKQCYFFKMMYYNLFKIKIMVRLVFGMLISPLEKNSYNVKEYKR